MVDPVRSLSLTEGIDCAYASTVINERKTPASKMLFTGLEVL